MRDWGMGGGGDGESTKQKESDERTGKLGRSCNLQAQSMSFTGVAMIHVQGRAFAKERAANLDGPGGGFDSRLGAERSGLAALGFGVRAMGRVQISATRRSAVVTGV
uniref:Uncharacterized protein n=1 Tax=Coccidioides posadasii RMSCC 3488 TaxID=454284 RepID=A0A0J6F960_COCPO|nr:hypothetical protein CPAG_05881 [Coccidioides posadasii RMSCC 3488]